MHDKPRYIDHTSGEQPVDDEVVVEVVFVMGITATDSADMWCWNHEGNPADILAYRVIEEISDEA
jgi:hypothetical protein